MKKEFEKLPEANKTLETDPADKKANLLVGRFLCFVKNDWDGGLARLLLGAEGPLRIAVDKDVAAASGGAAERIDAGDQWKKLAANADPFQKKSFEGRALEWYLKAVDEATGLNKVRVDKHIQELSTADNKWRILSHQLNEPKSWRTTGKWTLDGKTATGEAQAVRELLRRILPTDCVIQFRHDDRAGASALPHLSCTTGQGPRLLARLRGGRQHPDILRRRSSIRPRAAPVPLQTWRGARCKVKLELPEGARSQASSTSVHRDDRRPRLAGAGLADIGRRRVLRREIIVLELPDLRRRPMRPDSCAMPKSALWARVDSQF